MCNVLLRVRDKDSKGIDQRMMQNMAGDVVVVVPDGHVWGSEELKNPDWKILRLHETAPEALADMMEFRPHWRLDGQVSARKRLYFDISDEWLRKKLASGQVIDFTAAEVSKLMTLKRNHVEQSIFIVGD